MRGSRGTERFVVPVLAGTVLLAGCGGDGQGGPPPRAPKSLPGTPAGVEAALLTAEEVGDGWEDIGPTPFEQRGLDACPPTNVLTAEEDERRLGEAQTYHRRGESDPAPTFFESVSLWESAQIAEERLATFGTAPTACTGGQHRTPDGRVAEVTFTGRPVPDLGDEAVAQEVHFDFAEGVDATVDVIAVRLDDVIVFTNGERFSGQREASLEPAELADLTRQAVEKVERNLPLR